MRDQANEGMTVTAAAVVALAAGLAVAQPVKSEAPKAVPPSAKAPDTGGVPVPPISVPPTPAPPTEKKPGDLPSLDELLGIGRAKGEAPDPTRQELDRMLSGAELGGAFEQTVGLMDAAAARISKARDTGVDTQRVQEDIVRRLDQLIASMEEMQKQSQSATGNRPQGDEDQTPGGQRSRAQMNQQRRGEQNGEVVPPGRQDGALNPGLESARAAWGALPARVRETLMQGSGDRFSSLYKDLTEAYYRKLAEQGGK